MLYGWFVRLLLLLVFCFGDLITVGCNVANVRFIMFGTFVALSVLLYGWFSDGFAIELVVFYLF